MAEDEEIRNVKFVVANANCVWQIDYEGFQNAINDNLLVGYRVISGPVLDSLGNMVVMMSRDHIALNLSYAGGIEDAPELENKNTIESLNKKIESALEFLQCGQYDGEHHKAWAIDQAVRALCGDEYEEWVKSVKRGEDGPETYDWDEGIPP